MKPKFWQMPPPDQTTLARLPEKIRLLDQRLEQIAQRFPQAVFASSLAAEDMIITHRIAAAPAWLTGQRRSQSVTRGDLPFEETDHARGIAKFNPIFDWQDDDVWAYAQTADLPLNALYNQGYPSIGCEPCTRPVKWDEDIRAGRWWWESKDSKECGLHK